MEITIKSTLAGPPRDTTLEVSKGVVRRDIILEIHNNGGEKDSAIIEIDASELMSAVKALVR